jgi:hypothetical protein
MTAAEEWQTGAASGLSRDDVGFLPANATRFAVVVLPVNRVIS